MAEEIRKSSSGMEQLETVFDNMFDAVFILDTSKGAIVYANRAMCAMCGYPPAEAVQLTIQELCAKESCESLIVAMENLSMAARGSGQLLDWKARKKDGTLFWTETSLQKTVVSVKELVIAVVRDITERKQMEEELERARCELEWRGGERTAGLTETINELLLSRFCIDKAAIGIYHTTFEGDILSANDFACRSLGYTAEELRALKVTDIDPVITYEKNVAIKRMLDETGSATHETVHRRKDGTTFPVEIVTNNVEFQGKSYAFSFVRDISVQKRAIEELELTQFFVDKASIGIQRVSEEGKILFVNEETCRMLGYSAVELGSIWVFDIDPTFNPENFRENRRSIRTAGSRTFESINRRKDGSILPVEITVTYLEYQDKVISVSFVKDITERKEAEEALKESEARLKVAMDLARLVQWEYDVKSGLFTFDDQFYALYGTTAEQEGGMLMSAEDYARKFIPPEDSAIVAEGIVEVLAESTNQLEHRIIRPDGEERFIVVRAEVVRDQSGSIVKMRGANQDITERKRFEEALRQANLVVENSPVVLFRWKGDDEWPVELVSGNIIQFGYTPDDFLSASITYSAIIHTDDLERVTGEVHDLCEQGADQLRLEYRIMTRGGDIRWVNELTNVERDAAGGVINFEGIVIDVTERKLAEDSIRESRAKYQAIVDSFDGLIYVCSQDYRIEFMNRKLIERTGSDAVGEYCYEVMHGRDSVCPWCVNERIFAGEKVHWEMLSPKDGRWYYVVNVPIQHADGTLSKHAVMTDINELKLTEEKLREQKQLLEELNTTLENRVQEEVKKNREKDIMLIQQNRQAALGEMLDHIAHQWKQPLNSISLIIQLLREIASDGELTNAHVEETTSKTMALLEHMAQTIDIFREYYSPDKEMKAFSVKDSIDQALTFVSPTFRLQSIVVELDVDPGLTAFGYPKECAQVLLNILANARDVFKARKTVKPRVIIRAFAEDANTVVTIADNAGGISEAIMGRIFDFYFTTNESSGGTGIGLYMSKNIIEKNMCGTLSAENTDEGAQFRIEIPTT